MKSILQLHPVYVPFIIQRFVVNSIVPENKIWPIKKKFGVASLSTKSNNKGLQEALRHRDFPITFTRDQAHAIKVSITRKERECVSLWKENGWEVDGGQR